MDKILIAEDRYGSKSKHLEDDDMIDRLNNRVTVLGLTMCIFIMLYGVLVGKQINCWTPAEFKEKHDLYANSICWLKGSYYLPTEEITIPDRSKPRTYFVSYYQWTTFILLGMALLFLAPRYIWHRFTREHGLDIQAAVKMIKEKVEENKGVKSVEKLFKMFLDVRRKSKPSSCFGCYISYTTMYFLIKFLYIINSITQFFLLNKFLAFNFASHGFEGLNKLFTEGDWFESPRFPRVTMCDFMVRRLGSNQHWYSVQCNLPINMFNEKIFLGIWVWLIVITILNILSIIPWILFLSKKQRSFTIRRYLRTRSRQNEGEETHLLSSTERTKYSLSTLEDPVDRLVDYLDTDGYLIFHTIANNTDDVVASEIASYLFKTFKDNN